MIALAPEAVTRSRRFPPGPAPPLIGACLRDGNGDKPRHAAPRVEARDSRKSRVDDYSDAVDRQARLCDACGKNDLPFSGRRGSEGGFLPLGGSVSVKGAYGDVRGEVSG